ncbi:hypothetical protein OCK74_11225 [Chitinophagaceae bacterium LB-8]|jgi:hypothetical protein|uniref:Uncharacterized protein n=1 Tax=Paraflavisolibacter caeni TaxID=2982496 RepID=A0A9X2XP19_9BACT|nr:hypothetical protein [Paraflavisolibacter caeni]MCU7549689.1 hypothetical protein [Paraflavisolibacter caeni]
MKKVLIFLCSILIALNLQAQTTTSPIGAYYLRGEMEMAGGFKLDSNGRFQFFFSYGALDRQASGIWQQMGDHLVLDSEPKGVKDFLLTQSKMDPGKQLTLLITNASPQILPYVIAIVHSKGKQFHSTANEKGQMVLPIEQADSIVLQFQWCPEKASRFDVANLGHNHFSFRMLPSVTDVIFDRFPLTITPQEIYGPLPFSGTHICHFQRTTNNIDQ